MFIEIHDNIYIGQCDIRVCHDDAVAFPASQCSQQIMKYSNQPKSANNYALVTLFHTFPPFGCLILILTEAEDLQLHGVMYCPAVT